jgi:hypothetical protein
LDIFGRTEWAKKTGIAVLRRRIAQFDFVLHFARAPFFAALSPFALVSMSVSIASSSASML